MAAANIIEHDEIAKNLCQLFRIVDPTVAYFSHVRISGYDLYKYEFTNSNKPKYINVTGLNPYEAFKAAVNTLDYYNLDYLFLSEQKIDEIFKCNSFQNEIEMELE